MKGIVIMQLFAPGMSFAVMKSTTPGKAYESIFGKLW